MIKKTVLITGISGGMGSASARLFADRGFHVYGVDQVSPPQEIDEIAEVFLGNVTDEDLWGHVVAKVASQHGHLDALINIVGRNYRAAIERADLEQWRDMFNVNVVGMVASIKHTRGLLNLSDSPTIVNMSSISSQIGSIGYAAYCSTKGAVDSLTKSLALELAPKIRINAVAPGWIETPFTVEGLKEAKDPTGYRKEVERMHALDRVGTSGEVADVIYFLSSEQSAFMTGSIVVVDGGYLIRN